MGYKMIGELTCTPATLVINAMLGYAPITAQDAMAVLEAALDALHDISLEAIH
jgi:hypothetical protein